MKLLLIPTFLFASIGFSADNALRALLDVHAIEFQLPAMSEDAMCDIRILNYVDGVLEGDGGWSSISSRGGKLKMEALWRREGEKIRIIFAMDGMTMGSTMPLFPETVGTSKGSSGKPIFSIDGGWQIMGYWSLDVDSQGRSYYEDFQREVKSHKRVIAIAVRENKNDKRPNKALVPTPMSVTPAASAPVAPATGAAHL